MNMENAETRLQTIENRLLIIENYIKALAQKNTPEVEQKLLERHWGAHDIKNNNALMSIIICPEKINPNLIDFTPELEGEIAERHQIPGLSWANHKRGLDYYQLLNPTGKGDDFPYQRLEVTSYGLIEFNEHLFWQFFDVNKKYVSIDRIEYILPPLVSFMTNLLIRVMPRESHNAPVYFVLTLHKIKEIPLHSEVRIWGLGNRGDYKYTDSDTLTIKTVKNLNEINQKVMDFCETVLLKICRAFNLPVKGRWQWREFK